jgi:hypothetical protein
MPAFRTQLARDLACLLDLDDEVDAWSCLPAVGQGGDVPDFLVRRGDRHAVVDAGSGSLSLRAAAEGVGYAYEAWAAERIRNGFRLKNARDLLRYAGWVCPLGDRIKLLAGLDEAGSLTVAECLTAFSETRPLSGLAALPDCREARPGVDVGIQVKETGEIACELGAECRRADTANGSARPEVRLRRRACGRRRMLLNSLI